jgi:hypothetical protein
LSDQNYQIRQAAAFVPEDHLANVEARVGDRLVEMSQYESGNEVTEVEGGSSNGSSMLASLGETQDTNPSVSLIPFRRSTIMTTALSLLLCRMVSDQ